MMTEWERQGWNPLDNRLRGVFLSPLPLAGENERRPRT